MVLADPLHACMRDACPYRKTHPAAKRRLEGVRPEDSLGENLDRAQGIAGENDVLIAKRRIEPSCAWKKRPSATPPMTRREALG
jgi:hypothetical protein